MRVLVVNSGAAHSTGDVFRGLHEAMAGQVECIEYNLTARIDMALMWLRYIWRRAKLARPAVPPPTPNDVDALYLAGAQMIERALFFEVDGILMVSGMFVLRNILNMARRAHLRTGLVLTESPYDRVAEANWTQAVDVAWTNERSSVDYLRQESGNPNVFYLPHAIAAHHAPQPDEWDSQVAKHDVLFVGSCFQERVETLSAVDWSGIDFGLYGEWQALGSRSKLRAHLRDKVVENYKTAAMYRQAKVGLNLYRESIGWGRKAPRITHAESLNPRALELAACGIFQISNHRAEVAETFGDSIVCFDTPQQLEQEVRYYLAHDNERMWKAHEARDRVADPRFGFAARAAQVLAQLESAWAVPLLKGA